VIDPPSVNVGVGITTVKPVGPLVTDEMIGMVGFAGRIVKVKLLTAGAGA
jgi:hypothetical protein